MLLGIRAVEPIGKLVVAHDLLVPDRDNMDLGFSRTLIEVAHTAPNLTASPIEPSWIIEGNPVAEASVLSKSADGQAWTVVWQCSEGRFNWHYDYDETILILDGSIVLENETMSPTRYGPGDVIFFKDGAQQNGMSRVTSENLRSIANTTGPAQLRGAGLSKIKRTLLRSRNRVPALGGSP